MDVSIQDTPTERLRFHQLSFAQQEALLDGIRERRLIALRTYEELQEKRKAAQDMKLSVKAGKLADRMSKKYDAIDKSMTELEAIVKEAKSILILLRTEA